MNKIDIDTLSLELTKEIANTHQLEKNLPPKLLYRFRKWLKSFASGLSPEQHQKMGKAIDSAYKEIMGTKTLKKNEAMASFYDSGLVKMDFGSEVDPKVKDAALKWAKRRGLKVVEASLDKSANVPSHYVLAPQSVSKPQLDICVKQIKFLT